METFPDRLKGRKYYIPGNLGLEKDIKKRIEWWEKIKAQILKQKAVQGKDSEKKRKNQGSKKGQGKR
jgi:hypothetical protein